MAVRSGVREAVGLGTGLEVRVGAVVTVAVREGTGVELGRGVRVRLGVAVRVEVRVALGTIVSGAD